MKTTKIILLAMLLSFGLNTMAQVAINNDGSAPDGSAILDLKSNNKGFLPPRMSASEMNTITSPPAGLMVFNTTINSIFFYNGSSWINMYNNNGESCGTITYGGQTYETVVISTQCWMAENLNIGDMINVSSNQTNNSIIEKYCYDDNASNCDTYGGIYQWGEIMQYVTTPGSQGICPSGWHLPTDDEWKTMEMALGMSQSQADNIGWRGTDEGVKMKSTSGWYNNGNGTNSSGFNALPGGAADDLTGWASLGYSGNWWSSTEISGMTAWYRSLRYSYDQVARNDSYNEWEEYSFSVRCLKN